MKKLALILLPVILLSGCAVDICQYEARGIVEPQPPGKTPIVAEVAFPWNPILKMFSEVLPTLGQTRRKAIEEQVGYTEERKFTLFHVEKGEE